MIRLNCVMMEYDVENWFTIMF